MIVLLPSGKLSLNIRKQDLPLDSLCGFATRQNKKRGFLFVSKVLGKHYPVRPFKMKEIYDLLAKKLVKAGCGGDSLVLGFAETATGLGAGVFASAVDCGLNAKFLQTTRYHFDRKCLFEFKEEHSHAVSHIVYQPDFDISGAKNLILVDDEVTTGKTAKNFINQFLLDVNNSVEKIIIVSIKNWMSCADRESFMKSFQGKDVVFVSLVEGDYVFEPNNDFVCPDMPKLDGNGKVKKDLIMGQFGRFGLSGKLAFDFSEIVLPKKKRGKVLVLGTGEFSYPPYLLAKWIEESGFYVVFQSTTRSPILVGGEVKRNIGFVDNYDDGIDNFVYNVNFDDYEKVFVCYETRKTIEKFTGHPKITNVFFGGNRVWSE